MLFFRNYNYALFFKICKLKLTKPKFVLEWVGHSSRNPEESNKWLRLFWENADIWPTGNCLRANWQNSNFNDFYSIFKNLLKFFKNNYECCRNFLDFLYFRDFLKFWNFFEIKLLKRKLSKSEMIDKGILKTLEIFQNEKWR